MDTLLLTVVLQERVIRQHVFDGRSVTIGRVVANDIVLDNPTVSRVHAEISHESGHYFLNDLGSANGSFLNGKGVSREELHDGDFVGIGKFKVHVGVHKPGAAAQVMTTLHGQGATIRAPR